MLRVMTSVASLACLAALVSPSSSAGAAAVRASHPGKVVAADYTQTGTFHGAVDIALNDCTPWSINPGLTGSMSWNVTIRTTVRACNGTASGTQNEVKHTFADGTTFRVWHFNRSASSYDRTCDRCDIGDLGATGNVTVPTTHYQVDKLGTKNTSWYTVELGQSVSTGTIIGYLP
jgi:hypothetical protein